MSIIKVDPETVKDNPYQPRSHYPTKTIAEIAYSIEQIGIIHIPTGRQVDGHYELAEGHLRKRAYIKLKKVNPEKWGEMPLDIREISDRDMAIIALEENLRRQDITPLEQARAVDMYLINFTDVTETALAKTLNMTQGNISNMRRVLKCPDEVLQKIVDGKINFTMARELLVFQELNVGFEDTYRNGKTIKLPKDDKWLMLAAVRGVGGQYGRAATVDGIKRCIYDVADRNLKHLEKETSYWGGGDRNPLFDTRAAGCLKCPKMLRAFETKSQARHYCTDFECWEKKQEAHKKKQAAAAQKKMQADIAKRIEKLRKATESADQEFAAISQEKPQYTLEKRGPSWIALDAQGVVIAIEMGKETANASALASFSPVTTEINPSGYVLNHTYRFIEKPESRKLEYFDVTAQDLATAAEALGVDPENIELVKVWKSSGKAGTSGSVSAGWSKCTEQLEEKITEVVPEDLIEEEIGQRIAAAPAPVTEEMLEEDAARMDSRASAQAESISQEIPSFSTLDEVCQGCTNRKTCDGTGRRGISTEDGGRYICKDRVTKDNYQAVREKAKVDMPDSFKDMVKDKAGTRAIVLDLRELRLGTYRDDLKAGHAMLDGSFYERSDGMYGGRQCRLLEAIEDPEECTERCTDGFHYAYDSDKLDGEVHFVCSKPKCLTAKKSAFTRAKNAAGMGKKKAEMKAIRQAVDETTDIDKPRLLLIMEAHIEGSHVAWGYGGQHIEWLAKHLKAEDSTSGVSTRDQILKKLPTLSEDELRKLLVEFCLITLCYEGDVKGYKVQNTERLNRMGAGIQVEKK